MKFKVVVRRVGYGFKEFLVEARTMSGASSQAIEEAHNHEFVEKSSDYEILSVEAVESASMLWQRFGRIPVNDDGILQESFLHFPAGTHREVVWRWFEETHGASVVDLMFKGEKK